MDSKADIDAGLIEANDLAMAAAFPQAPEKPEVVEKIARAHYAVFVMFAMPGAPSWDRAPEKIRRAFVLASQALLDAEIITSTAFTREQP